MLMLLLYIPTPTASFQLTTTSNFFFKNRRVVEKVATRGAHHALDKKYSLSESIFSTSPSRRNLLRHDLPSILAFFATVTTVTTTTITSPLPANALVKGNAPPPAASKKSGDDRPKCTNVEECQALAERKEQAEREKADANRVPTKKTKGGVIYRDETEGLSDGPEAKNGDDVSLYYKVLKLGKRSYDGLSGEGTVVFSRGYGLEDDETNPREKSFRTTIGALNNIAALNEGIVGMKVGGVRRVVVFPQKGWRKQTAQCDGGPGGEGRGGELRTDYILVPTATMVEQEACFDTSRQPFPTTYAQQRRMAQRFDQSLILEVELVSINSSS